MYAHRLVGAELFILGLFQGGVGVFQVDAVYPAQGAGVGVHRGAQPEAVVGVFLHRLPRQEMLQELHVVGAQVGCDRECIVVIQRQTRRAVQAHRPGIAVGIRIGIAFAQVAVAVGLVARYIAGGILFQVGGVQYGLDVPALAAVVVAHDRLLLIVAGVILVAAVGGGVGADTDAVAANSVAVAILGAVVVVGPALH